MGKVSITRIDHGIKQGLSQALELIGGLGRVIKPGDTVMLKPNLNGEEGCTDKRLVEFLIQMLFDLNVKKVFIGESTFGNARMTAMFFQKTGYASLAKRHGINLINLNESEPVETPVKNPLILRNIRIAREVFETDKIVNLPNMKVHYATAVTLSLKNLKGLLVGDEKRRFHELGLDKAIVDLNNTIPVHLNIMDCISCMEKMGPRGGEIVPLGLIMAGEDRAEMDYIGCKIMGYELSEVNHLRYFVEMNRIDLTRIEALGERLEEVKHPFKKVSLEDIIPREFTIHNKNACSACMNAFLLSCRFLEGKLKENIDVFLGSLVEEEDISSGLKLAFGNCCPPDLSCDMRIRGCPPYPFDLKDCLKEKIV